MIESLKDWFAGLSQREKILVTIMLALLAAVLFWLALYRPLDAAIDDARADYDAAVMRHARIAAMVEALNGDGDGPEMAAIEGALDLYVSQSAGELGFTLDRNDPAGADRVTLTMGSARVQPLLSWLAELEAGGVRVESLTVRPAGPDTVSVEAELARAPR